MPKSIWLALKRTLAHPVTHLLALLFPPTGRRRRPTTAAQSLQPAAATHTVTGLALIIRLIDPPGAPGAYRTEPQHPAARRAGPPSFIRPYLVAHEQQRLHEAAVAA